MKMKYVDPEIEITEFDNEDVITTSGGIPTDDSSGRGDSGEGNWYYFIY